MSRFNHRVISAAVAAVSALALASCSTEPTEPAESTESASTNAAQESEQSAGTVTVEDNEGTKVVPVPPKRVVALDNRSFEMLDSWGIKPVAAPLPIVPSTITGISANADIIDIGSHREPNLESIAAAEPDLIVSGMRFRQYDEDMKALAPDAVLLEFEPREGQPLDAELIRQTEALGEVFGKQAEAKKVVNDFTAALQRAKSAYNPEQNVMAVNVSGGKIGYSAPHIGRVWGPVFDMVGLTPALELDNASTDHQGDDISVEAIAATNPDWLLVLDRDAGVKSSEGSPEAMSVIDDAQALSNVTAVKDKQTYEAPKDTYTNESILTYTEILNGLADAFEAAK